MFMQFPKRGLPYTHILIWLAFEFKFKTSDDIESIVSAEMLDKNIDPLCHGIVSKFMIHGPCGCRDDDFLRCPPGFGETTARGENGGFVL